MAKKENYENAFDITSIANEIERETQKSKNVSSKRMYTISDDIDRAISIISALEGKTKSEIVNSALAEYFSREYSKFFDFRNMIK